MKKAILVTLNLNWKSLLTRVLFFSIIPFYSGAALITGNSQAKLKPISKASDGLSSSDVLDLEDSFTYVDILANFFSNFPMTLFNNIQYKGNVAEVLSGFRILFSKGINDKIISKTPLNSYIFEYYNSNSPLLINQDGLDSILSDIFKSLREFKKVSSFIFSGNLETDLVQVENLLKEKKINKSEFIQWLKIIPFIYSNQDNSNSAMLITEIENRILELETKKIHPIELAQLFISTNYLEILDLVDLKLKNITSTVGWIQGFKNNYLEKIIKPVLQKKDSVTGKVAKISILSLEEIHPILTGFRSLFGIDCSMLSVPLYGGSKSARLFWIRKTYDNSSIPEGYVFVREELIDEKIIPTILAISAPKMGTEDILILKAAIGKIYNSDSIGIIDYSQKGLEHFVNLEIHRRALKKNGIKKLIVNSPSDWSKITEENQKIQNPKYPDYYKNPMINNIELSSVADEQKNLNLISSKKQFPFSKNHYSQNTIMDRALIGASIMESKRFQIDELLILKRLNLTFEELNAGRVLIGTTYALSIEDFKLIERVLDFKPKDLSKLDIITLGNTLAEWYQQDPQMLSIELWKSLTRKVKRK